MVIMMIMMIIIYIIYIIDYLIYSGKIAIDIEGKIAWIYDSKEIVKYFKRIKLIWKK